MREDNNQWVQENMFLELQGAGMKLWNESHESKKDKRKKKGRRRERDRQGVRKREPD